MQIDHNTKPILGSCDIDFEARLEAAARDNEQIGVRELHAELDFKDVMRRAHDVIAGIAPHSSAEARGA